MTEVIRKSEEELASIILDTGAVDIRDLTAGEEPFLYSSGNFGPGYLNVKGMVGRQRAFKTLTEQCALRLVEANADFDFVAGNATGGMIPGYQVREDYQRITGKEVPYIYVRNTRKIGGHQEHTTGLSENPEILRGSKPLIFEELVNFAQTTCNSKEVLAKEGYPARFAGTLLHYENPEAILALQRHNLQLIWVVRLQTVLDVAEEAKKFSSAAVADYRAFLKNPQEWQTQRGLSKINF